MIAVGPLRVAPALRHMVLRLGAPWTVHVWSAAPRGDADDALDVRAGALVRREADGATAVELFPSGVVTVRCRCAPPVIHVRQAEEQALLPAGGSGMTTTALRAGDALLMPSCAVLEQSPSAMPAVTALLAGPTVGGVPPAVVEAVTALLEPVSCRGSALAVVVNDPTRWTDAGRAGGSGAGLLRIPAGRSTSGAAPVRL